MLGTFSTRFDLLHNMVVFTAYIKPPLKWMDYYAFDAVLLYIVNKQKEEISYFKKDVWYTSNKI